MPLSQLLTYKTRIPLRLCWCGAVSAGCEVLLRGAVYVARRRRRQRFFAVQPLTPLRARQARLADVTPAATSRACSGALEKRTAFPFTEVAP